MNIEKIGNCAIQPHHEKFTDFSELSSIHSDLKKNRRVGD